MVLCSGNARTCERPYRCTMCNAAFSRWGSLKGHMRYDTFQISYKCTVQRCLSKITKTEEPHNPYLMKALYGHHLFILLTYLIMHLDKCSCAAFLHWDYWREIFGSIPVKSVVNLESSLRKTHTTGNPINALHAELLFLNKEAWKKREI